MLILLIIRFSFNFRSNTFLNKAKPYYGIKTGQNQYIIHCVIVTGNDLNQVMCLLCGRCPKIVNSDGNAKESQNLSVGNFIFDNNCSRVNFSYLYSSHVHKLIVIVNLIYFLSHRDRIGGNPL